MKRRDREAVSVYRGALSAIDNAEAVPVGSELRAGALEGSAVGVGSADVSRRTLTEQEMLAVVLSDAEELCAAARALETVDSPRALRLRRGADLLLTVVGPREEC